MYEPVGLHNSVIILMFSLVYLAWHLFFAIQYSTILFYCHQLKTRFNLYSIFFNSYIIKYSLLLFL